MQLWLLSFAFLPTKKAAWPKKPLQAMFTGP